MTPTATRPKSWKLKAWIAFLIAPALITMCVFVIYPIISALAYAFFRWEGLVRGEFAGLDNFRDVLFGPVMSPAVWHAFRNNVIAMVSLLIIQNGGGFFLAWVLFKEPWGHKFHRISVFVPVVLSTIIVGFLWKLFLNPNFGMINQALKAVGLGQFAMPWLGDPVMAFGSLIVANAWHYIGFPTLVYLAGMQRIPREVIEAARLDGVGEGRLIRHIVWPLVAPSTTVVFTLLFIGSFNWFEIPYVMVGLDGSPYGSTDVLGLVFYRTAFGNQSSSVQDFGHGSALAACMFLFIAICTAVLTTALRKREIAL